jgi:hypothetical protein
VNRNCNCTRTRRTVRDLKAGGALRSGDPRRIARNSRRSREVRSV